VEEIAMFFARLLAQLLAFVERFAFGKWLIWMFDMLLAGATWMFRGFGQMLVALGLFAAGSQVAGNIPHMNIMPDNAPKTVSQRYGVSVTREESVALGKILSTDKSKFGRSFSVKTDKPEMWSVYGRKFWVAKERDVSHSSHVDKNGTPLEKICYSLFVAPVEEDFGQYKKPRPFCKPMKGACEYGGTEGCICQYDWPKLVEECVLEGKTSFEYWWG
jgi:hypothetical protein